MFGSENFNTDKNEQNTQIEYKIYPPPPLKIFASCLTGPSSLRQPSLPSPQRGPAVTCMRVDCSYSSELNFV